jgi:hypothetical protein
VKYVIDISISRELSVTEKNDSLANSEVQRVVAELDKAGFLAEQVRCYFDEEKEE